MYYTTVLKGFFALFLRRGDKNVKIVLKRIVENGLQRKSASMTIFTVVAT